MSKKGLKIILVTIVFAITISAFNIGWSIVRAEWHDALMNALMLTWQLCTLCLTLVLLGELRVSENLYKVIHYIYRDIENFQSETNKRLEKGDIEAHSLQKITFEDDKG